MIDYNPAPERDPKKDLGYFWVKPNVDLHYFRSNKTSNLVISHCGLIAEKSKLVEIKNLTRCTYCQFIENQRDTRFYEEKKCQ